MAETSTDPKTDTKVAKSKTFDVGHVLTDLTPGIEVSGPDDVVRTLHGTEYVLDRPGVHLIDGTEHLAVTADPAQPAG